MDGNPIKILLIEDNPGDARLIREMLIDVKDFSFHLERVDHLSMGLACLAKEGIDVVLLDLSLPDSQGLDTFDYVYHQAPGVPIIVFTILADEMTGMKAVEKGAQDYLFKGQVDSHLLVRAIRYAINRKQIEETLRKRTHDLGERVKELRCLYGISSLIERSDYPLAEILQGAVNLIPCALQYPDSTCVRIICEDQEFRTKNFRETDWKLSSRITVHGRQIGSIEIYYLEEKPKSDEGPFLKEEIRLVNDIAERVKGAIERRRTEEELDQYRSRLEDLVKERTAQLITANEQLRLEISERRRSEELLRESEAKYSTLVERAKDGVIITHDGVCQFANRAMSEITGYTVREMAGMPLARIAATGYGDFDNQEQKPCCLTSQRANFACEMKIRCKDGTIKEAESSTAAIQFHGKSATLGIVRDVTEHKRIEGELQKAQKLESLGILAGGIAHDFNNILVSILGSFSLLKLYAKPRDKFFDYLARAEKAALRAKDLTQQLLTFSRGGAPIKKTASMAELLRDTVSFSLRGSKVKSEFSMPDNLWPVEIDEGQISQVINNLIINADQAMPNGGIIKINAENVTIETKSSLPLKEGKYVEISVTDQGIGIPEENLNKIFDPFFTTKEKGGGLGLASAYSIIKKHDGYISVKSQVGFGTTFYVYLPVSNKEIFTVEDIEDNILFSGQGEILLMDDEEDVRDTLGDMLNRMGFKVTFSKDGAEALRLYQKEKESGKVFDAVILDLTIPGGMGGKDAIQELLKIDPEVKAIVSSGYSNFSVMDEYRRYGFSGVLTKPYVIEELSEVLHKVLVMGIKS